MLTGTTLLGRVNCKADRGKLHAARKEPTPAARGLAKKHRAFGAVLADSTLGLNVDL